MKLQVLMLIYFAAMTAGMPQFSVIMELYRNCQAEVARLSLTVQLQNSLIANLERLHERPSPHHSTHTSTTCASDMSMTSASDSDYDRVDTSSDSGSD